MTETNIHGDSREELNAICHIVTPVGMLGYGFVEEETTEALQEFTGTGVPTALILDSGSTDSGPSKLALGGMTCPRQSYVRDLSKLVKLVHEYHVPLIFSSAGGDGSDDHVNEMIQILEEIVAKEENRHYRFKTIAIFSEVKKTLVLDRLRSGAISGCGTVVPPLTEGNIDSTPRIVSQMGPEPFYDAMVAYPDFDIIVGGRAYDPSPYVAYAAFATGTKFKDTAYPMSKKLWGAFTHMGKIMECGAQCATPKSHGASATIYSNGAFDISAHRADALCTPTSVAAHTLYEKSRPDILFGPGGYLDLTASTYEQLQDGRTCRVRGGSFTFSRDAGKPYQLKLEAATVVGYRTMFMGSIKDPILIRQLDRLLESVKAYVRSQHRDVEGYWDLDFHVYGQNQISAVPDELGQPSEIFLIGEALAPTQEISRSIAASARFGTAHGPYQGQKATSGNLAWGIGGKLEIELGLCAEFCIYHLMDLKDGEERLQTGTGTPALFSHRVQIVGKGPTKTLKNIPASTQNPSLVKPLFPKAMSQATKTQSALQPAEPTTLGDIALFLRSKNAGPYEVTFDVVFATNSIYQLVRDEDILNKRVVAGLLKQREEDIIWIGFFDQAMAFKVTIPRLWKGKVTPNGSRMENDIWAAQRYLPLMNMKLPNEFVARWKEIGISQ